jgi:hypothetical protein
VRITFTGGPAASSQTLYYFTTDLSNDGIRQQPGFLKFCEARGTGGSLLKSSSYLMFENGFSRVRDFLLTHSKAIVQDDSGIPIAAFDPAKWLLRFFRQLCRPDRHLQAILPAAIAGSLPTEQPGATRVRHRLPLEPTAIDSRRRHAAGNRRFATAS